MVEVNEDVKAMMTMLLNQAKKIRESHKYSGDEEMVPCAFIFGDEVSIMMLPWKDDKEKYQMAAAANAMARKTKAKSLSFVTDTRWVDGAKFSAYYHFDQITEKNAEQFQRDYHRILKAHGGQVKNLPRELWQEAVVVFTNGPGIPLTIQMAPYEEGENDTIRWLPRAFDDGDSSGGKSDMLTDWWN
jgi:hypothetical protein